MTDTKTMPRSDELEVSVLSALLLDNSMIAGVIERVDKFPVIKGQESTSRVFYTYANHLLYEAIKSVYESGSPVDIATVTEKLRTMGKLEAVGGVPYIYGVADNVAISAYAEVYTEQLIEYAYRRNLIIISENAANQGYTQLDKKPAELWQQVEANAAKSLSRRGSKSSLKDDLIAAAKWGTDDYMWSTGFPTLDRIARIPPDLTVIAASNSHLKTALMYALANKISKRTYDPKTGTGFAAIASPDQPRPEILANMAARKSGIPLSKLEEVGSDGRPAATVAERKAFATALKQMQADELRRMHILSTGFSPDKLESYFLRQIREGAAFLCLDSLQAITVPPKTDSRQVFEQTMYMLKDIANTYEIPIIVLCQVSMDVLRRNPQDFPGKRPLVSDLSHAPKVINDLANMILLLYYLEKDNPSPTDMGMLQVCLGKRKSKEAGLWSKHSQMMHVQKAFSHILDPTRMNEKIQPFDVTKQQERLL